MYTISVTTEWSMYIEENAYSGSTSVNAYLLMEEKKLMRNFLKSVFITKWQLYQTTVSVDQHFSMLEELRSKGIEFKTKGLNFGGGYGGGSGYSTIYHIYTRK